MKYDRAMLMAEEIVRLVTDLEKEFKDEITKFKGGSPSSEFYYRTHPYRNWIDTVVNALPTKSFTEALWADVFATRPGYAPVRSSRLVDVFVEKWRVEIAEWEFIGNVGE